MNRYGVLLGSLGTLAAIFFIGLTSIWVGAQDISLYLPIWNGQNDREIENVTSAESLEVTMTLTFSGELQPCVYTEEAGPTPLPNLNLNIAGECYAISRKIVVTDADVPIIAPLPAMSPIPIRGKNETISNP